jgi:hypothetical protein
MQMIMTIGLDNTTVRDTRAFRLHQCSRIAMRHATCRWGPQIRPRRGLRFRRRSSSLT